MDNSTLRYLNQVRELESTLYTQKRLIVHLQAQASKLGNQRRIEKPSMVSSNSYYDAADLDNLSSHFISGCLIAVLYVLLWLFIPPLRGIVNYFKEEGSYMGAALVFIPAVLLIPIHMVFASKRCAKKAKKQATARNQQELKEYSDAKIADQSRVQRELRVKEQLNREIQQVEQQMQKTERVLNQYYSLNIIHPKYRSLVPVSSFCEYFETGRCSQLTGHEGAYNIYEQEIRMNLIATKLDVVISKLDEIRENQYTLYQAIRQCNHTLSRIDSENNQMIRSLNTIQENSALTEYNTRSGAIAAQATGEFIVLKELLK